MVQEYDKRRFYKQLTWDDLNDWAGSKIVSRGRGYQQKGLVEGLAHTDEGGLIAWVHGTKPYATWVDIEQRELTSACTCPYWDTCKHAVAVVLAYLGMLKEGLEIPSATNDDRRLALLRGSIEQPAPAWKAETYPGSDADLSAQPQQNDERISPKILAYLEGQPKEQLIQILLELEERISGVHEFLEDRHALEMGRPTEVVAGTRNAIHEISSEPGWRNEWTGEGFIPDYSGVRRRSEALLANGYADEVIELGEELLKAGMRQIEVSEDGGETAAGIAECMDIVFMALSQSTLSPAEQLLWAVEAVLTDDYDLCTGAEYFWDQEFDVASWAALADRLSQSLDADQTTSEESRYRRDRLANWLVIALEESGRSKEIIPLLEREAVRTDSYLRLVAYLVEVRAWKEAEEWIRRGIEATESRYPGIASGLRDKLRVIREREGDWLAAAFLRAEDFFRRPSLETYQKLQEASERAGVWHAARAGALRYLETGELPISDAQEATDRSIPSWPLPEIREATISSKWGRTFPFTDELIDIAIDENCVEDVARWYEQGNLGEGWRAQGELRDDKIAEAVVEAYPDLAIAIWKGIAGAQIAKTQTQAYQVAARYLRKIHRVLEKEGDDEEWRRYLAAIREANIRKRRLLEILDGLIGRPIVDG